MGNKEKSSQLGMPFGTANGRLRKMLLFNMAQRHGEDECYRCGERIETVEEFSIEHKEPWFGFDTTRFWDLDNITFSHLVCNVGARHAEKGPHTGHGNRTRYMKHGCRCKPCIEAAKNHRQSYRWVLPAAP